MRPEPAAGTDAAGQQEIAGAPLRVLLFAKAPRAGQVKTRLVPALGAAGAARLQRRMMLHALHVAHTAAVGPVSLYCAPAADERFFRALSAVCAIDCKDQADGDLGARMAAAFAAAFALAPACPVLLMGCDCPALSAAHLRAAAAALAAGRDAAFVTAADGGYVLIALKQAQPQLFADMRWSTPAVMDATRTRMRQLGLMWDEVAHLWDVDIPADLARLAALGPGWRIHAA